MKFSSGIFRCSLLFFLTFSLLLFNACQKVTDTDLGVEPELPPEFSLTFDAADFVEGTAKSQQGPTHGFAALTVGFWQTILKVGLTPHVLALAEAFKHPAVLRSGTWTRSYNLNAAGDSYTLDLLGTIRGNFVDWEMKVSKSGAFQNYSWFTGTTTLNNSSGNWRINGEPNKPSFLLTVDWQRNNDGTGKITFMDETPNTINNGNYIIYEISNETPYNTFFSVFNAELKNMVDIEWNRRNNRGRVKSLKQFNDTKWHCWDSQYKNTDCN